MAKHKITFGKTERDDPQYLQVPVLVDGAKVGWLEKHADDKEDDWFFISQNQGDRFSVLEGDNQPRGTTIAEAKKDIREDIVGVL